jgi:hypothetical protein
MLNKSQKKILSFFIIFFFFSFLTIFASEVTVPSGPNACCKISHKITINGNTCQAGQTVAATSGDATPCEGIYCNNSAQYWSSFCIINTVLNIGQYIFYFAIALSFLFISYAAFLMASAYGDPKKMNQGKQTLIFALIGFAISLLGKFLPYLVAFFLGMKISI